jgi:hypothetical protein
MPSDRVIVGFQVVNARNPIGIHGLFLRFCATVVDDAVSLFANLPAETNMTPRGSPLSPGSVEHKFYCPSGGGLMLVNELHGGTVRVELIGSTLPAGDFPTDGVCGD